VTGASVFGAGITPKMPILLPRRCLADIRERFLQDFKPLTTLRLKFSWGRTGTWVLAPNATLSTVLKRFGGWCAVTSFPMHKALSTTGLVQSTLGKSSLVGKKRPLPNAGFESAGWIIVFSVDLDVYLYSNHRPDLCPQPFLLWRGSKPSFLPWDRLNNQVLS